MSMAAVLAGAMGAPLTGIVFALELTHDISVLLPLLIAGDVRSDDPADVRSPADVVKTLGRHTSQGGIIWIFGL